MAMDRFSEAYEAAQRVVKTQNFPTDWDKVINGVKELLTGADGPVAAKATAVSDLRKKIAEGAKQQGSTKGKEASEQIIAASKDATAVKAEPAAMLKMLKHLYLIDENASQKLWVYSPPKAYTKWVFDELDGLSEGAMKAKLADEGELYTPENRKVMAAAAQQAKKVCGKMQAELGIKPGASDVDSKTTSMVQKWFFGDTAPSKEDMSAAITKLRDGFKAIGVACGGGSLIFSDEPTYRARPGKWQNFGMIKSTEKMMAIYLMKGFLDEAGKSKPAERWLCVETIIHELSHKVLKTDDYAYDFHGLKPGGTKFPAGAGLDNADSWGYFACEMDGILPSSEEKKVYKIPSKVLKVWSK